MSTLSTALVIALAAAFVLFELVTYILRLLARDGTPAPAPVLAEVIAPPRPALQVTAQRVAALEPATVRPVARPLPAPAPKPEPAPEPRLVPAPGHHDGDGCTFPAPGHLVPADQVDPVVDPVADAGYDPVAAAAERHRLLYGEPVTASR